MNKSIKTHRLFFALWPSDQVRQSINEVLSSLSAKTEGRVVRADNLHETLHFIGQVTGQTKDCMHAAAQSVSAEAIQLKLDRFGYFSRAKIFWLGSNKIPDRLIRLHNKLGKAIEECGFTVEGRLYSPHITLLKKCRRVDATEIECSIPWSIEEFVLVESFTYQEGVNYQVIERYPLT